MSFWCFFSTFMELKSTCPLDPPMHCPHPDQYIGGRGHFRHRRSVLHCLRRYRLRFQNLTLTTPGRPCRRTRNQFCLSRVSRRRQMHLTMLKKRIPRQIIRFPLEDLAWSFAGRAVGLVSVRRQSSGQCHQTVVLKSYRTSRSLVHQLLLFPPHLRPLRRKASKVLKMRGRQAQIMVAIHSKQR